MGGQSGQVVVEQAGVTSSVMAAEACERRSPEAARGGIAAKLAAWTQLHGLVALGVYGQTEFGLGDGAVRFTSARSGRCRSRGWPGADARLGVVHRSLAWSPGATTGVLAGVVAGRRAYIRRSPPRPGDADLDPVMFRPDQRRRSRLTWPIATATLCTTALVNASSSPSRSAVRMTESVAA